MELEYFAATFLVLFIAIGLHEYAHAKVADMAGDPTPRLMGRVTLDLTKHFEPMGTIMIVVSTLSGFGIGWGKPVMVDPRKMKNPRWDHFASVIAGPLSNLTQAVIFGAIFRLILIGMPNITEQAFLYWFLFQGVFVNIALMLFNLIPLGPLDGHWLVGLLMPEKSRLEWFKFNRTVGSMLLLAVIIIGQVSNFSLIGLLIGGPANFLFELLVGRPAF